MRTDRIVSQNDFGNGSGFILHLILCSLLVIGGFVGLLWLGFILSFGRMSDGLRNSATSHLEEYLSSQVIEFPWDISVPVHNSEVNVTVIELKPDYLATLSTLGPCDRVRCDVDRVYRASAEYEVNGELFRERFVMTRTPYWSVAKSGK